MIRKTLTVFSLTGLVVSLSAWGVSYSNLSYADKNFIVWLRFGCLEWNRDYMVNSVKRTAAVEGKLAKTKKRLYRDRPRTRHPLREWMQQKKQMIRRYEAELKTLRKPGTWEWAGFSNFATLWRPQYSSAPRYIVVPLWIPCLLCVISLYLLPLHRRRKRLRLGLCLGCGYDLRASSEKCPECGQVIE